MKALKSQNKGNKLGKGMLTVVDHMPAGLSVKTGNFRANSWRCKGGRVSSRIFNFPIGIGIGMGGIGGGSTSKGAATRGVR